MRWLAWHSVSFTAVSVATIAACSALTDFSGLTGSGADGSVANDSSLLDQTALDAATTDGGLEEASDAAARFCATVSPTPTFCEDFDDPSDASVTASWDDSVEPDGSSLALATNEALSAPRSLHGVTTSENEPYVEKAFPTTKQISLDMDFLITELPTAGAVSAFKLSPSSAGPDVVYYMNHSNAYFQLSYSSNEFSMDTATPTLNVWHHVAITIKVSSSGTSITAAIDGMILWQDHVFEIPWQSPTAVTVEVGLPGNYEAPTSDAYTDNIVVRAQ